MSDNIQNNEPTENEKLAFEYMRVLLGIIGGDRDLMILWDALKYADPLEFFPEPKSKEEIIRREIFITRSRSYWNRKMLAFNADNYKTINEIRNWEQYEVTSLRSQLMQVQFPPTPANHNHQTDY